MDLLTKFSKRCIKYNIQCISLVISIPKFITFTCTNIHVLHFTLSIMFLVTMIIFVLHKLCHMFILYSSPVLQCFEQ